VRRTATTRFAPRGIGSRSGSTMTRRSRATPSTRRPPSMATLIFQGLARPQSCPAPTPWRWPLLTAARSRSASGAPPATRRTFSLVS